VGEASNTILGLKTLDMIDNRADPDVWHRDDVQLFDE
jgi:hypothetical protein